MIATEQYPLVSIILTTYNGSKYLPQQMDSLLAQTYPNIEIVALDDGSTDDTVDILRRYAAKHPRMQVIVNETNLGYIRNFDKGCGISTGGYIALCDQDDYWDLAKISKMVAAIGHYPLIYCDSFVCDENLNRTGKKISDKVNCRQWNSCLQQAIYCRIYGHATLMTRSFYEKAHPFITVIPHDWWLSFTATIHGGITFLNEPLNYYRQHAANLFGAVGGKKSQSRKEMERDEKLQIRARIQAFYNYCPADHVKEKKVLGQLVSCYRDFSLVNNLKRFSLFLRYRNTFLLVKKHSAVHRFFFCFKMLFKIK